MNMEALHRRARQARARAQVKRWQYCQRHHAQGTWHLLARLLADSRAVFVVSESESEALGSEGIAAEAVGAMLEPPRTIRFVPEARIARLESRREIPVRLGPELLAARHLVLSRFGEGT